MAAELTPAQQESLKKQRDKWVARSLRNDWDPLAFIEAVPTVYKLAKMKPPKVSFAVDSPLIAWRCIENLKEMEARDGKFTARRAREVVKETLASGRPARPAYCEPHDTVGWAAWRARYEWLMDHFREGEDRVDDSLRPYFKIDEAGAFWWWFFEDCCIGCGPPEIMRFDRGNIDRDEAYRLHCSDGPALRWPDGFALYYWRGVALPKKYIEEKDTLTADDVFSEPNQERRRALGEILGWDRILESAKSKRLQRDDYGELIEAQLPSVRHKSRFIRVKCPSTGRVYVNPVPPETRTCREGLAWRFGLERAEDYQPVRES